MLPLIVAILIVFGDQLSKHAIRGIFQFGELRPVVPGFFDLTYIRNTGAAWGMFGGQNTWLMILSLVMLVFILKYRRQILGDTWDHRLALGLMLGGIIGNLIDRVKFGWVTDFLHFHAGVHEFPAFNIADSAICCGVGIYIISAFWTSKHPLKNGQPAGSGKPAAQ